MMHSIRRGAAGAGRLLACSTRAGPVAQSTIVIVSTTTSTQDSGLLDVLVPMFEKQTGLHVKTISVGTGQALALARARRGRRHARPRARPREEVRGGRQVRNRRLVMYNDFVIIGPPERPGEDQGRAEAPDALKRIAESQARFVSRGDKSGTHVLEQKLWKQAGVDAEGRLVHRVRAGHGRRRSASPTTGSAYTLTDRGDLPRVPEARRRCRSSSRATGRC